MIIIQYSPQSKLSNSNPLKKKPIKISLPGSKYIANRVLLLASLAKGKSVIENYPDNEDINQVISEIKNIAEVKQGKNKITCWGNGGQVKPKKNKFYTHDNGTFTRLFLSVLSLSEKWVTLSGSEQMSGRPMGELVNVLKGLGVQFKDKYKDKDRGKDKGKSNDYLPLTLKGPLIPGQIEIDSNLSSQFISSLLIVLPLLKKDSELLVKGKLVSYSYIAMTMHWMKEFGVTVSYDSEKKKFTIPGQQSYSARKVVIPSDVVSASYFIAGGIMSQQDVWIENFDFSSKQGEIGFIDDVKKLGFKVVKGKDKILKINGATPSAKKDLDINFNYENKPDVAQSLLVLLSSMPFKKMVISKIAHLRFKETNRVENMAEELKKVGVKVNTTKENFILKPNFLKHKSTLVANVLNSHNDHRMAMSLSLLATETDFIALENENAIKKSFPDYYEYLEKLNFKIKALKDRYTRLILIGYRGSGKSSIGSALAKKLGLGYLSSDKIFQSKNGPEKNSIKDFVEKNGWEKFRKIETSILQELVKKENVVLDLGGGVIEKKENLKLLKDSKDSLVIYLEVDYKILKKRLAESFSKGRKNASRPELPDNDFTTLSKRLPIYREACDLKINNYDKKQTITIISNVWNKIKKKIK